MRADKMTMAASVEARVPFLDHKLVEFMLHVPGNLIFKDGITKYLLKTVARKYLPAEIVDRKKVGFGAPTIRWFEHGTYFPSYFQRVGQSQNHVFSEHALDRNSLLSASPSRRAVQKWVLQNFWAFIK
jgi:asparagine synthetase B (glutamine-hydrolysing)